MEKVFYCFYTCSKRKSAHTGSSSVILQRKVRHAPESSFSSVWIRKITLCLKYHLQLTYRFI